MKIGATGRASTLVDETSTAVALGSGDVEVFATPALVALCEAAAVDAVAGGLPADRTTVGVHIALDHLAATLPDRTVEAVATLTAVEGRKLTFEIEASDERGLVGRAEHRRVVVDRAAFLDAAAGR